MSAEQKVWKSGSWVDITSGNSDFVFFSPNTPPNPKIGDLWYDDNNEAKALKIWNGLIWSVIIQPNDYQNVIAQRMFA